MQETYTVKEVADLLGYSTNSIYTFLKEKQIKSVRIGKGRFRIPLKEVQRLLASSRNMPDLVPDSTTPKQQTLSPLQTPTTPTLAPKEIALPDGAQWHPHVPPGEIPNLFEWFIATASILLGASTILFNRYVEEFSFSQYLWLLSVLRIWFTAAGTGLLLTNLVGLTQTLWHRLFYVLLCVAYVVFSTLFLMQGQWDAVVLYGIAGIILLISYPLRLRGVVSFILYLFLFLLLFPLPFLLGLTAESIALPPSITGEHSFVYAGIWLAAAVSITVVAMMAWTKKRFISYLCILIGTVLLIGISLWYASHVFWSRSIVIIVIGFCTCFIPPWNSFRFRYFQERTLIFSAFAGMVGLLLFAIGVIALVSANQVRQTEEHLENTVGYGSVLIQTALDTMQGSLQHAAQNPQLYQATIDPDQSIIEGVIRGVFDGSRYARSILLADATGTIISVYPHTDLLVTNVTFREYFQQVKEEKKPIISNGSGETAIAVPILAPDGTFAGALVGSLNGEYLNLRLQQLAQSNNGEYVIVTDTAGEILISPFSSTDTKNPEPIRMTEYDPSGKKVMTATQSVDRFGWTISASQPISSALRLSNTSSFVLFFILCLLLIALGSICIWKSKEKSKIRDS